jgi:SAM-dependent methyltransferase
MVRLKYGQAAKTVLEGRGEAVCATGNVSNGSSASSCCGTSRKDVITADLYTAAQTDAVPEDALLASLGCGNPTALAQLKPGEVVLDLGSGGGIDVLLSARRVGLSGYVFGLDMTDEMLALANQNKEKAGITNVSFLKGTIEEIPLPDNSVDVVISNCVINLSADKEAALREAFRVLKPGGRLAVSDIVLDGGLPTELRSSIESYVGCVAGALERADYLRLLHSAGFTEANIEATRRYTSADLLGSACCSNSIQTLSKNEQHSMDGKVFSAFIRAVIPNSEACCSSGCCAESVSE